MINKKIRPPKVIAYYLPQFHEIPENNLWWGKGFTEWTNVKNALPFTKNQIQPRVPLNEYYYDLMNKETIMWQTELAKEYGLYGFCYFHYYFKDGRKILEKPAENLLRWKDIDQKYCFFWANIEWRRTWSTREGASTNWTAMERHDSDENEVLLEQDYGTEEDWEKHFIYLLQFFLDERYIRIEGMPVFAIYHIEEIECADDMMRLWNEKAKEHGLNGIYFLSVNSSNVNKELVKGILHYGINQLRFSWVYRAKNKIRESGNYILKLLHRRLINNVWEYDDYWRYLITDRPYGGMPNYPGATVRYDETPRRKERAFCLINDSPKSFENFMEKWMFKTQNLFETEYIFLDAWNEWGEGNYLEPDTIFEYKYLESLRDAIERVAKK